MKNQLITTYQTYMESCQSIEDFAEENGLSEYDALTIIELGKKLHGQEAKKETDPFGKAFTSIGDICKAYNQSL